MMLNANGRLLLVLTILVVCMAIDCARGDQDTNLNQGRWHMVEDVSAWNAMRASEAVGFAADISESGIDSRGRGVLHDRLLSRFIESGHDELESLDHAVVVKFWQVLLKTSSSYRHYASRYVIPWYEDASHWRGANQQELVAIYALLRPMKNYGQARLDVICGQMADYIETQQQTDPDWVDGQSDLIRVQLIRLVSYGKPHEQRTAAVSGLRQRYMVDQAAWEAMDPVTAKQIVFAAREIGMSDSEANEYLARNVTGVSSLRTLSKEHLRHLCNHLRKHSRQSEEIARATDRVELEMLRRVRAGEIDWGKVPPREMTRFLRIAARHTTEQGKREFVRKMRSEWVERPEVLVSLSVADIMGIDRTLEALGESPEQSSRVVALWLQAGLAEERTLDEIAMMASQLRERSHDDAVLHDGVSDLGDRVIDLAREGRLEEHPTWWRMRDIGWLLREQAQRDTLQSVLKGVEGGPDPAVALLYTWACREHDDFVACERFLDEQIEVGGYEGDELAMWYVARAMGSYVDADFHQIERTRGKRFMDRALALAESEPARVEVVCQIAKAYASSERIAQGRSFLNGVRGSFSSEASMKALARVEMVLDNQARAVAMRDSQRHARRERQWRAELEEKIARAREAGNASAVSRYEQILRGGYSRDGGSQVPVGTAGGI